MKKPLILTSALALALGAAIGAGAVALTPAPANKGLTEFDQVISRMTATSEQYVSDSRQCYALHADSDRDALWRCLDTVEDREWRRIGCTPEVMASLPPSSRHCSYVQAHVTGPAE